MGWVDGFGWVGVVVVVVGGGVEEYEIKASADQCLLFYWGKLRDLCNAAGRCIDSWTTFSNNAY